MAFIELMRRLGEPAAIAIVDNWERYVGMQVNIVRPCEQRWILMMRGQRYLDAPDSAERYPVAVFIKQQNVH